MEIKTNNMGKYNELIKKLSLNNFLLDEEIISDFLVDSDKKKAWLIELDLLYELDRVCRKHNLKYCLIFGSLLGYIRHKGFIPWDDDLDVLMSRMDYEKLLKLSGEFKKPYFLQCPGKDNDYFYAMSRIRNSETTAADYPFLYCKYNMGIFIDINIYDEFDDERQDIFDEISKDIIDNSLWMRKNHKYLSERDKKRIAEYTERDPYLVFDRINKMQQQFNGKGKDKEAILSAVVYGLKRDTFNKGSFDNLMEVDLYGVKTFIPTEYDYILSTIYGDYMKLPPADKRGLWHSNLRLIADIPYKQYLKKIFPNGYENELIW